MIHISDWGHAAELSLEESSGVDIASTTLLLDNVEDSDRTTSEAFELTNEAGEAAVTVHATYLLEEDEPTLLVTATEAATGETLAEEELVADDAVTFPTGERLVFDRYARYARLAIAHDWSVVPLYTAFLVTLLGLAVAIFSPYRRVVALATKGDRGVRLDALVRYGRGRSPMFEDRVREALAEAFEVDGRDVTGREADGD
jgi:3D (Asp-Asp-Asp) domain-containing protein